MTRAGRAHVGGDYSPPAYFDDGWATVFVQGCQSIGANPYDVAGLIIGESGWNPAAANSVPCYGLNQICPPSAGTYSGQYTAAQYQALPVSKQLPFAFKYWQGVMQSHGLTTISGRDLYWLNWVPALYVPNSPDSYVIQREGDPYYSADLDVGNKGYITAGDLETRIQNMETCNPDLFAYLTSEIEAAGGGAPGGAGTGGGAAVITAASGAVIGGYMGGLPGALIGGLIGAVLGSLGGGASPQANT